MRSIDADALKKDIEENSIVLGGVPVIEVDCAKVLIDNAPTTAKIDTNDIEYKAYCKGLEDGKKIARSQGEFTDLERKVIADSINYLLGAELLEENGYTETVINALKSVLQKIGAEENHL